MPRNGSGVYSLPVGNPVVTGTTIDSTWANPTMSDIAVQLNNVLTRDGLLGPTLPILFVDGTVALPGVAFAAQPSTGVFRAASGMGFAVGGTQKGFFSSTAGSPFAVQDTFAGASYTDFKNSGTSGVGLTAGVSCSVWDGAAVSTQAYFFGSGSTYAGGALPALAAITYSVGTGGVVAVAANAAGTFRVFTGGTIGVNERLAVNATGDLYQYGVAAATRQQFVTSGTTSRWSWGKSSAAESGSNAGSDFFLSRYADAGTLLDTPFSITRLNSTLTFSGSTPTTAGGSGGSIVFTGGAGSGVSTNGAGGSIFLTGGAAGTNSVGTNSGGAITITGGVGGTLSLSQLPGAVSIAAGASSILGQNGAGVTITASAGFSGATNANGGNITLTAGAGAFSGGNNGKIILNATGTGGGTMADIDLNFSSTSALNFASNGVAANGAVATAMSSVGPTGASTTIVGWIRIKVAGTYRYQPYW